MPNPNIICLTPIKNEAWILDRFLKCASLWADYIIIADQNSNDGSREIARSFKKVILIENPSKEYNEQGRQKILINAARKIEGPRLLIALDADEVLTANSMTSSEWAKILLASKGTVVKFRWINIRPDFQTFWSSNIEFPWGFIDDGSEYVGETIHSYRIPIPNDAPVINLHEIMVLHYQYTDWNRMKSKHRWYQCWERINNPNRHPIDIYRQYHHMCSVPKRQIKKIPEDWFAGYEEKGIDMKNITKDNSYWWDEEILKYFETFGTSRFRHELIWDVDWNMIADRFGYMNNQKKQFTDPRTSFEKYVHQWLEKTQPIYNNKIIKLFDKILKIYF
jgi:hypothetical protein